MSDRLATPGFFQTVKVLLLAAHRRAIARSRRQQELLRHRTSKKSAIDTTGSLGWAAVIIMMAVLHSMFAFFLDAMMDTSPQAEVEQAGKIVVSSRFLREIDKFQKREYDLSRRDVREYQDSLFSWEAHHRTERLGGSREDNEKFLRNTVRDRGTDALFNEDKISSRLGSLAKAGPASHLLGSLILVWWFIMMVFQGEGLELDLQRRRHPMWEWLFSHPVGAGAVFFAEMLSPIAANPVYLTAPIFWGFLFGLIYGAPVGIVAALVVGAPIAIAAACLGKALEIAVILRVSPRSRGPLLGFMSWIGYVALMALIFCVVSASRWGPFRDDLLHSLGATYSAPLLRWMTGAQLDGSFSFLSGVIFCSSLSSVAIFSAVSFSVWGARQGLSRDFHRADLAPSRASSLGMARFRGNALYRKELLWFKRDRSALVQVILIPLTIASFQLLNLRGVIEASQSAWSTISGAAVVVGTYLLWIVGPRSLSSEGSALWIALTWPRGLEDLLKAKARLWSTVATGVVFLILGYAAVIFPEDGWKILLVGMGWIVFGRSMAEKAVTLVSIPSSGETEPVPIGRRWAASLGMVTFAVGVLSAQWHIAIMGIVYSWITAAAMWQNFRARLPFLYDPWSEKLPPPPTLMHSMIAVSALVEGGSVGTGLFILISGITNVGLAQSIAYGLCAAMVCLFVSSFLAGRGVGPGRVWYWYEPTKSRVSQEDMPGRNGTKQLLLGIALGLVGGVVLGFLANGYLSLLLNLPVVGDTIRASQDAMAKNQRLIFWYGLTAVAFAPLAEEYLFRGLLFRALDREWGGWRAVLGGAAFFAVYHQPLAWVPVGLMGIASSLLFKKTGFLVSSVVLHTAYNAVVVSNIM